MEPYVPPVTPRDKLVYFRDMPWLGFGKVFGCWRTDPATPWHLSVAWCDGRQYHHFTDADERLVITDDPRRNL